jgi:alanine racemase
MIRNNYLGYRPTWAEVDLANLEHNFLEIKKRCGVNTKIMITVKADAYGHGLIPISKRLERCGVDFFGVASIDEGIELRRSGIKNDILILGLILKKDILPLFKYNLFPTICDWGMPEVLSSKARFFKKRIGVHIKVDTGMGRIGMHYHDAYKLIEKISRLKGIDIRGIFTHLSCADLNKKFTFCQIGLLDKLVKGLSRRGIKIPLVHAANSIGFINYKDSHFNMVRPGLIIYGLSPKGGLKVKLKPVLSLKTKVVFVKRVPKGIGISYGHSYITQKATRIATLPIGYGDGYPRNLSNKAEVLIKKRRFRIVGRICMDQLMVEVGNSNINVGDEVVLIGSQGKETITAEELALKSKTISYEIVCGLGSRIPRIYKN